MSAASVSASASAGAGGSVVSKPAEKRVVVAPSIVTNTSPEKKSSGPAPALSTRLLPISLNLADANRDAKITVHAASEMDPACSVQCSDNGFLHAVMQAYSEHLALRVSPDDLWIAILQQFAQHVTLHAEEFRGDFVQHGGKKELVVKGRGTGPWDTDWPGLVGGFAELIRDNTVAAAADAFEPSFSTTTATTRCAALGMLMNAMEEYFSYTAEFCCGIPEVVLVGTRNDWTELQAKVAGLGALGAAGASVAEWLRGLDGILTQFIRTYDGAVDETFWSQILSETTYGSGSTVFSGWLNSFFLYTANGEPFPRFSVKASDYPVGYSCTPIKCLVGEGEMNVTLLAGSWHCGIYPDGSIGSVPQWLVMEDQMAKGGAPEAPGLPVFE